MHTHAVLTWFSMKRSTSFRSLSWQSGWVASRYVMKESVLVMISWPAMRKMKAWPTISSVVKGLDMDVGWLLWGGSTVRLVEDRASVTMSKSSTPTELVECRASSTICRKSFCLWGQEKKRYIRATEWGWRTREETPGWSSWTTQEEQVLVTGLFEMVRAWCLLNDPQDISEGQTNAPVKRWGYCLLCHCTDLRSNSVTI